MPQFEGWRFAANKQKRMILQKYNKKRGNSLSQRDKKSFIKRENIKLHKAFRSPTDATRPGHPNDVGFPTTKERKDRERTETSAESAIFGGRRLLFLQRIWGEAPIDRAAEGRVSLGRRIVLCTSFAAWVFDSLREAKALSLKESINHCKLAALSQCSRGAIVFCLRGACGAETPGALACASCALPRLTFADAKPTTALWLYVIIHMGGRDGHDMQLAF